MVHYRHQLVRKDLNKNISLSSKIKKQPHNLYILKFVCFLICLFIFFAFNE